MFMEINFFEMILRTTGSFFAILILARIIGKKQLSQLTFFHYVTGITVGSIAAEIAAHEQHAKRCVDEGVFHHTHLPLFLIAAFIASAIILQLSLCAL